MNMVSFLLIKVRKVVEIAHEREAKSTPVVIVVVVL